MDPPVSSFAPLSESTESKETMRYGFYAHLKSFFNTNDDQNPRITTTFSGYKAPSKKSIEENMLSNGSLLLEELIKSSDGKYNPFRMFSFEELHSATNCYSQCVRQDALYDLYKGILKDNNCAIMVKCFKWDRLEATTEAITDVVVSSQMNKHKNVLQLLGCCLETKVPVLVFEFPQNGKLSDLLLNFPSSLSWESRLRIAREIANAVTYLHMALSKPVIHRDIKPSNIWLNENYVAKLSDFSLSLSRPLDQDHVEAMIKGTYGFVAPEGLARGIFAEQSDVYGFGSLLFELLFGAKKCAIERGPFYTNFESEDRDPEHRESGYGDEKPTNEEDESEMGNKVTYRKRELLQRHMEGYILIGADLEQHKVCTQLVLKCINHDPKQRPTMQEVAQELRRIVK